MGCGLVDKYLHILHKQQAVDVHANMMILFSCKNELLMKLGPSTTSSSMNKLVLCFNSRSSYATQGHILNHDDKGGIGWPISLVQDTLAQL